MTFKEQIEQALASLPSKWRDQLVTLLCQIKEGQEDVDCNKVKECETLTVLSDFEQDGTEISIKYTDEHGVQVTRTFDVSSLINSTLDDLDPSCLATPTEWNTMTYTERLQALIDAHCTCCDLVDIEYDSSNSDLCTPFEEPILFALVGQSGQGTFPFAITGNIANGVISIPTGLTGTFNFVAVGKGADYLQVTLKDSSNVTLSSGATDGFGVLGYSGNPTTGTFNITQLDHIIFDCISSG